MDDKQVEAVEQRYDYLLRLKEGLEKNPELWIASIAKNQEQLVDLLTKGLPPISRIFNSRWLKRLKIGEAEPFAKSAAVLTTLLPSIESVATLDDLRRVIALLGEKVHDKDFSNKISQISKQVLNYQEEVQFFMGIRTKLEAFEKAWESDSRNPLPDFVKYFHGLKNELPQELRTKFNDKAVAKYVEKELGKSQYSEPIPIPRNIKMLVERILVSLERAGAEEKRLEVVKIKIKKTIEEFIADLKKKIEKIIGAIKRRIDLQMSVLNNQRKAIFDFVEVGDNAAEVLVSYMEAVAKKIELGKKTLEALSKGGNPLEIEKAYQAQYYPYNKVIRETLAKLESFSKLEQRRAAKVEDKLEEAS